MKTVKNEIISNSYLNQFVEVSNFRQIITLKGILFNELLNFIYFDCIYLLANS